MTRREQLEKATGNLEIYRPLIDEVLFLEAELKKLKQLPFIQVCPGDPSKQKATPASKQYKELLQQYTCALKALERRPKGEKESGDSDLFASFMTNMEGDEDA